MQIENRHPNSEKWLHGASLMVAFALGVITVFITPTWMQDENWTNKRVMWPAGLCALHAVRSGEITPLDNPSDHPGDILSAINITRNPPAFGPGNVKALDVRADSFNVLYLVPRNRAPSDLPEV